MKIKETESLKYILDKLEIQGKFKSDRYIYLNPLLFYTSILANLTSGLVLNSNGKNIKFFGVTLAGSGFGKDFSFGTVADVFNFNRTVYHEAMKQELIANVEGDERLKHEVENSFVLGEKKGLDALLNYIPRDITVSIEGTKEGFVATSYAVAAAQFSSINVSVSELGDIVTNSAEALNKLKEAYDGTIKAKVTKSENTPQVDNLTTNILLFGSEAGVSKKDKEQLLKLLESGLYRRSVIFNFEPKPIERQSSENVEMQEEELNELFSYIDSIKAIIKSNTKNYKEALEFGHQQDYKERLVSIQDELIDKANDNLADKWLTIDVSSIDMIDNIAHLLCILDSSMTLTLEHLESAYSIFKESRETISNIINPISIHKDLFNVLKLAKRKLSIHELDSYGVNLGSTKQIREETIELFKDYAYYKGYVPNVTGKNTRYFYMEEPSKTEMDKIICSIDVHDYEQKKIEPQASASFLPLEVNFFGEAPSIEALVRSNKAKSFTTSWYEPTAMSEKLATTQGAGHRRADNAIKGQNLIGFDIDDGMTLKEARELLKDYTYIIYTTRSHRKEKNGEMQGDRFRILVPTTNKYYVDPEQHKKMYKNIAEFFGFKVYDQATTNISRLWFTNPEAEVFTNVGTKLNAQAFIPETEQGNHALEILNKLMDSGVDYEDEVERRVAGIKKWFVVNTATGSRNSNLYSAKKLLEEIGVHNVELVLFELNNLLSEPLSDKEVTSIARRN